MRKFIYIYLMLLFVPLIVKGQQYQFSQYNYSMQQVNPASVSLDNFATASFIYRSQRSQPGIELNNLLVSAKYPILGRRGDRWSGIGVTIGHDQTGYDGLLEKMNFGVNYAFNFFLDRSKRKVLSWGVRGGFHMSGFNMDNLTTGNQYKPGGFDPGISSGEDLGALTANYFTIGSGLMYESRNRDDERLLHWGIAIQDFNRPNESFSGEKALLPVTYVGEFGFRAYENYYFNVYPEVLYSHSASTGILSVGMVTTYKLDKYYYQLTDQEIKLHTKYLSNQGILLGFQWHKGPVSAGVSYEIPVNNRLANRGLLNLDFSWVRKLNQGTDIRENPVI
ncbi:PorP/SprF family type IX secretion system membrane protein [Mangrovivirga cuniculi]|nr:PorP/SprF family type IX secretion system membrane protein [Mangrovivirga cuniculi]